MSEDKPVVGRVTFGASRHKGENIVYIESGDGVIEEIAKLRTENAGLNDELAVYKEAFEKIHSNCHELIKQNAALRAMARRIRVMVKHHYGIIPAQEWQALLNLPESRKIMEAKDETHP